DGHSLERESGSERVKGPTILARFRALSRAIILQHVSSVPSRSYRSAQVDRLHQTTRAPVDFRHNARQLRKLSCQVFAPISQHLPAFFPPKSPDPSSPRPIFAKQRILHINGRNDFQQIQIVRLFDPTEIDQIGYAFLVFLLLAGRAEAGRRRVLVIESKPQRARHPKTAVVCRAAAKTDDDFVRSSTSCVQNHFTNTERGRANWISFAFR